MCFGSELLKRLDYQTLSYSAGLTQLLLILMKLGRNNAWW